MRTLVRASVLPLRHSPLPAIVLAGLLMPVVAFSALDGPAAVTVLRWTGVVLAAGWLCAIDDPVGEVLAASPFARRRRSLARLAAAAVVILPTWAVVAGLVQWRQPSIPVLGFGVEALAHAAVGVAIAAALRAWRDMHCPSQLAVLGLLAVEAVITSLPRWYALNAGQTWGPPWEAAQLRWTALILLGTAVLWSALADPLARPRRLTAVPDDSVVLPEVVVVPAGG